MWRGPESFSSAMAAAVRFFLQWPGLSEADVTALLKRWNSGDKDAFEALIALVYQEMKAIARRLLRDERPGHILDTHALVHEAYLRLVGQTRMDWNDRRHFFGAAANVMRRILVDQARRRLAARRGGGAPHDDFESALTIAIEPDQDVLALNEALDALSAIDPDRARVVELRYFAGLSLDETGALLGISPQAVSRDWTTARAWLARWLDLKR
jgi:RNA polymerase sigma-70 factor (ECF subfamily)